MKAAIRTGLRGAGRWIRSRPAVLAFLAGFGAALGAWLGYILYVIARQIDWYEIALIVAALAGLGVFFYAVGQSEDGRRR